MFYVKLFCSSIMSARVFIVRMCTLDLDAAWWLVWYNIVMSARVLIVRMCTLDLEAGGWSGIILLCQRVCL